MYLGLQALKFKGTSRREKSLVDHFNRSYKLMNVPKKDINDKTRQMSRDVFQLFL